MEIEPNEKKLPSSVSAFEVLGGLALITFSGENLVGVISGILMVGDGLTGSHIADFLTEKLTHLDGNTSDTNDIDLDTN